ncbi:MAG TPA: WG repeat-containing protein [Candidatus Didemnitutus sp.]|nr:WG repeat-containing protein [Candidatus Didemnitutus sp.]
MLTIAMWTAVTYSQGNPISLPPNMPTIRAQYVGEFHDGLCAFSVDSRWGFFDIDGQIVIPPVLDHVAGKGYPSFHDGLCLIRTPGFTSTDPRVRFVDTRGLTVPILGPRVIDATQFSQGLAFVLEEEEPARNADHAVYHIYAINTKGVEFPGSRQTLRDHKGRPVLHQPLFHDGRSVAQDYNTHLFGYIDTTGVFVIQPSYVEAGIYSEHFAAVRSAVSSGELRWGFIERSGRMAIEPRYEHQPGHFSSGRAGFVFDAAEPHMIGYLDTLGEVAIYPRNSFNGSMDLAGQPTARAWKVGSSVIDDSPILAHPVPFMNRQVFAFNPVADPNDLLVLNTTGGVVRRLRNPTTAWVGDLRPWQIIIQTALDDSLHVIHHEKGNTLVTYNGTPVIARVNQGCIRTFRSGRAFVAQYDEGALIYRTFFIDLSGTGRIEIKRPD